ncbi:hypothetical protein ET475_10415 [Microbacterium protaetiae]|uniref:Uncharacterized protein n=1 Tax=Microbacterium protaetiae TaxID=2509458 RepID=A0A4P6ER50_9MICO|nr:hypothetical protein [Microbacterium protaetiae]QAY60358.1 hypothetical protein ET475_10415 [Microbacterium protaetiae]
MVISQLGVTELRRAAIRLELAADSTEDVIGLFWVVRLSEAVLQLAWAAAVQAPGHARRTAPGDGSRS